MISIPTEIPALLTDADGERDGVQPGVLSLDNLGEGDVVVRVAWSSVNFKDGLASRRDGKVARLTPLVPGIDLAGTVVDPGSSGLAADTPVLVHGYDLGVAHHGGYAHYARVPAGWVVPLPAALDGRQAMTLGTAGFTAARSVLALQEHGLQPGDGPLLVTGATGGVGSAAVAMLAATGHHVTAVTGKADAADWLRTLGATDVVDRAAVGDASRPLRKEQWAGAVDCVGGDMLAAVLASLRYGAAVAASGNTGGVGLPTSVFPFILRGVSLLGIDSVQRPIAERRDVWARMATDLRPAKLEDLATETVQFDGVPAALERILAGGSTGRTIVAVS